MEEPFDDSTRADRGAPRRRRAVGWRVAALALASLACLMLVHWLTYSVEKVTTEPAYIEVIPPTASGLTAAGASPAAELMRETLFAPASFSSSTPASVSSLASVSAVSAQGTQTPPPAVQASRPNFIRRFFQWVSELFGGDRPRPNSPPVISGVSLSSERVMLTPRCPPRRQPKGSCAAGDAVVRLVVSANDPDGDRLAYVFQTAAGSVSSERQGDPHAAWDLSGAGPGTHELSVVALERAADSEEVKGRSEPFRVRLSVGECECVPAGQTNAPCPASSIEGPRVTSVRRRFTLSARVADSPTGLAPSDFRWTLSAGAVSNGQGTRAIEVDPAGLEPQVVKARVNFRVGPRDCSAGKDVRVDIPRDAAPPLLRGKVFGEDGRPLAGMLLTVVSDEGEKVGETNTLPDGSFSLRLPYGSYSFAITSPDGVRGRHTRYVFRPTTANVSLTFTRGATKDSNTSSHFPTPAPTPGVTPTPTPASTPTPTTSPTPAPTPNPTPTPFASPTPAGLKRVGQDRITVERPERFLEGQTETLTCELAMVEQFVIASETFGSGVATVIDKPGPVAGSVNPELARAFGEGYTSHARFALESDDLVFSLDSPREQAVPAEAGRRAAWVWKARLKEGARGSVNFRLRLDVVWRPLKQGGEEIVRRGVWEREFRDVPTGLPVEVKASKYGSVPVGLAALGAFVLPGRRRRLDRLEAELGAEAPHAPPEPEADEVLCTVYARREARPGDAFLVQAFAHLAEQADALAARARKSDEAAEERGSEALEGAVERGSRLTFTLQMPGLEIDEPSQTFVWKGDVKLVQFGVTVPADSPSKSLVGKLTVCQESVPVGHVRFTLNVVADAAAAAAAPTPKVERPAGEFVRYRQAFISYCSKDRAEVLRRLQMLRLVKLNFHQDLLELEPGQRWEPQLYKWIDESDVFFLFWSRAAKESPWVEKELQYALRRKGERDEAPPEIVPVILEGPPPVKPPPYLSERHFNDTFLYFLRVEDQLKAERAAQPPPAPPGGGAA